MWMPRRDRPAVEGGVPSLAGLLGMLLQGMSNPHALDPEQAGAVAAPPSQSIVFPPDPEQAGAVPFTPSPPRPPTWEYSRSSGGGGGVSADVKLPTPATKPTPKPAARSASRGGRPVGATPPGIVESLVSGGDYGAMMPGMNAAMNQYIAQQNAFANTPEQQAVNARYNELLTQHGMTPPAPTPQTIEEYNAQFFQPPPQATVPPVYDPQGDWTSRRLMNALMLLGR